MNFKTANRSLIFGKTPFGISLFMSNFMDNFMRILITGTPGVGKTTVSKILGEMLGFKVVSISEIVERDKELILGYDRKRQTYIVDIDKLREKLKNESNIIIEGHLSHFLDGDIVIVLRLHPEELRKRLESRGYSKGKVDENAEAEALDVCLIESVERHKNVFEVDTTGKSPKEVVECIIEILEKFKNGISLEKYKPGKINWLEEFV